MLFSLYKRMVQRSNPLYNARKTSGEILSGEIHGGIETQERSDTQASHRRLANVDGSRGEESKDEV